MPACPSLRSAITPRSPGAACLEDALQDLDQHLLLYVVVPVHRISFLSVCSHLSRRKLACQALKANFFFSLSRISSALNANVCMCARISSVKSGLGTSLRFLPVTRTRKDGGNFIRSSRRSASRRLHSARTAATNWGGSG